RDFRLPVQPLAWFHVPSDSGHDFVWRRSSGIEFVQAQRLFLVSRVQEHETDYFPRVTGLEPPDIDSRIGMAHQHEWSFFARGLQPCVQIVYYLIDGLQSDRRAVALTEIGVIITAHARKARNFWLDRLPVFGGSSASGNEDNGGKARRLAIAIYRDAPLPNADHTLFRKGRQRCRQTQENGHNSRSMKAEFESSGCPKAGSESPSETFPARASAPRS